MAKIDPKRGEIWLVDLGLPEGHDVTFADLGLPDGHELKDKHPVMVVQSDLFSYLPIRLCVPLTGNTGRVKEGHAVLLAAGEGNLRKPSAALVSQTRSLDLKRFKSRWGEVQPSAISTVLDTLATFVEMPEAK